MDGVHLRKGRRNICRCLTNGIQPRSDVVMLSGLLFMAVTYKYVCM